MWSLLPLYLSLLFLKSQAWKRTDWKLWNSSPKKLGVHDCQKAMPLGFHLLNQMFSGFIPPQAPPIHQHPSHGPPLPTRTHSSWELLVFQSEIPFRTHPICTCPLTTWEQHRFFCSQETLHLLCSVEILPLWEVQNSVELNGRFEGCDGYHRW